MPVLAGFGGIPQMDVWSACNKCKYPYAWECTEELESAIFFSSIQVGANSSSPCSIAQESTQCQRSPTAPINKLATAIPVAVVFIAFIVHAVHGIARLCIIAIEKQFALRKQN